VLSWHLEGVMSSRQRESRGRHRRPKTEREERVLSFPFRSSLWRVSTTLRQVLMKFSEFSFWVFPLKKFSARIA
jgi:hypothetical protein